MSVNTSVLSTYPKDFCAIKIFLIYSVYMYVII